MCYSRFDSFPASVFESFQRFIKLSEFTQRRVRLLRITANVQANVTSPLFYY